MTIQTKAIEQYFQVVLFITLYNVVLTFKSVGETPVCDNSNESYNKHLHCLAQSSFNLLVRELSSSVLHK